MYGHLPHPPRNHLQIWSFRYTFQTLNALRFPLGKAANTLRGAMGMALRQFSCDTDCRSVNSCRKASTCAYARIFEPGMGVDPGPSGLRDWPRPFLLRALHLDGKTIPPGGLFHFDVVLFQGTKDLPAYTETFRQMAAAGLGPLAGRARLVAVTDQIAGRDIKLDQGEGEEAQAVTFRLEPGNPAVVHPPGQVKVTFLSSTELKSDADVVRKPEFGVLFRRLRDRASNLRACYQGGPLELDFTGLGQTADAVKIVSRSLRQVENVVRRSSKTGQTHGLGGFMGEVTYAGNLGFFIPFLEAGQWIGVGRQTTWGKGQYVAEWVP